MAKNSMYLANRIDNQARIMAFGDIRFDVTGNIITEDEYKVLKKVKDFKSINGTILDIKEINLKSVKELKKAIFSCETKPATIKAKRLLRTILVDLVGASEIAEQEAEAKRRAKVDKEKSANKSSDEDNVLTPPQDDLDDILNGNDLGGE